MGFHGLQQVALKSQQNTMYLSQLLAQTPGTKLLFSAPSFHEFVLQLPISVEKALKALSAVGMQAGFSLKQDYPELGECLLICATETKTREDLERFANTFKSILSKLTVNQPEAATV